MSATREREATTSVLVWFEDDGPGRAALQHAEVFARDDAAHLTVLTVATHERLIGCGRCLTGTALWNIEMDKIAREDLATARRILASPDDTSYELVVGNPADAITEVAQRVQADIVVIPQLRHRRLVPPNRRNVNEQVARSGGWRGIVGHS